MAQSKPSGSIESRTVTSLTNEEQETIIKQRMQVDERSIRRLVKKLSSLFTSKDEETRTFARLSLQADIESVQANLLRLVSIGKHSCQLEIRSYQQELQDIEREQCETRIRIQQLKQQLKDVQQERANKLEYDAVAIEIGKFPTRAELKDSLSKLSSTLEGLRSESEKCSVVSKSAGERMKEVIEALEGLHNDVGFEVGERERREVERGEGEGDGEADGGGDGEDGEGHHNDGEPRGTDRNHDEDHDTDRDGTETPRREGDGESVAQPPLTLRNLNPAAAVFQPGSVATTEPLPATEAGTLKKTGPLNGSLPQSTATGEGKRTRSSRKRDNAAVSAEDEGVGINGSDEEGAWEEGQAISNSTMTTTTNARASKRLKTLTNAPLSSSSTAAAIGGDDGEEEGEVEGESEEEEGSIQPVARMR